MNQAELERKIEDLIEPLVAEEGLTLVSVELHRQNRKRILSVYLNKKGGIDLETCARMSEEIGRRLDVEDLIKESYELEVASPGIERVLKKPREYAAFIGRKVDIWLNQPFEGRKKVTGVINGVTEKEVSILTEGEEIALKYEAIRKGKLVFNWDKSAQY